MTRRKEIVKQAEMFRQPYRGSGNYSTSMDIKNAFQEGAEWADKTMIERVEQWLIKNNRGQTISSLHRFLEEE
jgi:hypothetical protein